ncbi:tRNA pseudouridine synthase B [Hydrogenispora ethanolica]|uniref:tRNA pseudouridine synthase B n=1 Tax=Hydrogenispora ethanolica TaxID=1082276 RepID=A0A4R1QS74_HYDET|nr:tRNA pseudouridine(55) synthase TruB [Hydrogenispora ethanolica]TCL55863.1 tRNA pseudouridine synthase B [Hydrogenispora ethanolica]
MWHGITIINKERGLTSHQVVSALRRILHQSEIGHTGTLDPEATGVLVVGFGQGTRSFPYLNETTKLYRAEVILGRTTDTQDATGKILGEKTDFQIDLATVRAAIKQLTGEIRQVPPMFSAVKVHGSKLYDLARKGLEVERQSRPITVLNWHILAEQPGYHFLDRIPVEIACSKGSYIRTLIHDLGQILGCGAHMGSLIRLRSGDFRIEDSVTVDTVKDYFSQGRFAELLLSLNVALDHLVPLWIGDEDLEKVLHGGKLSFGKYQIQVSSGQLARVLDRNSLVRAVVQLQDAGSYPYWQPVKVFQYS